ncbi:MAG: rhomboid family intramembrane serine protease, partial [Elusimicrobia bacterium]|nr:rhomboid family intramembrane serine protease [Elusimicrobiota bacterium]
GGAAAGLAQNAFHSNSSLPMIGASGAVASIMGAFLVRYPNLKIRVLYFVFGRIGIMEMPAWVIIPLWFLQQVFMALMTLPYAPEVGYLAHIGGFLFGTVGGITIKKFNVGDFWEKKAEKTKGAIEEKLAKGRSELRFDNFDESEKIFKEILQIDPKQADAYLGLLDLYEKKKDLVLCCTKAAELIGLYYANVELVLASQILNRVKPVLETVKLPDSLLLKFGGYYEKDQQFIEAANIYRSIIHGNSAGYGLPKAIFQLGRLLKEKLGNKEEGVRYLERLLNPPYALEWEKAVKEVLKKE